MNKKNIILDKYIKCPEKILVVEEVLEESHQHV